MFSNILGQLIDHDPVSDTVREFDLNRNSIMPLVSILDELNGTVD